ncbi:hypothetical protein N3K66_007023 [Trichothecium roseum]|uniref:Uncharacterized protein n=1 Tax=Trichothecium roseum TaxID=47278 RepID=A0ACC0UYR7_9HYPO|nr:hypothetical protein N3K66_007023 [Trichothecium roseum]
MLQSQGNVNDGHCETEATASSTVNYPPSAILTPAQPTLPTTGEAPETVTEAAPPQSLPDSLWAQAYDEVQKDDPVLTEAYTKLLNDKLASGTNLAAGNNIGNQTIWGQRQAQFTRLVGCGLERTKKAFDTKERIHEGTRLLKSVTELISTSLKHAPQAATAWAGVCLLVQAFENPTTEAKAFLDGISHVINRMEWYSSLSTPLLDSQSPHDALQDQLKKRIISLYRKLLIYLIKAICYLFKKSAVVILGDMVKLYDWDSGLKALKDAEQGLRGDISVFHDTAMTQSLDELVVSTKNREQSEQEVQCLRHLLLSDPRHDKVRIKDMKGGLFDGASSWIFHHEQYLRWRQHDDTKLLWVKGDPGKGKTMLMISMVEKLEEEIKQPGNSLTLAYFLCQGTNKDLDNATAVLRGLIYFLAASNRQLVMHLRKQYDISGSKLFEGQNSFHALSIILENMLCDKSLTQTYIAIDALDECTHNRDQLLKLIAKLTTVSPHTKWLVTSRNRPEIEEILSIGEPEIKLSLEITANAEQVAKAVDAFIDFKISKLPALKNDHNKKCKVQNLMRERASGTFLWVALVVGVLERAKPWNILDKLKRVPAGLNETYDSIMDQVKAQDDWEYCQAILAVATLAYRPLHITELGILCKLPSEILSDEGNMRDLIGLCGLLERYGCR